MKQMELNKMFKNGGYSLFCDHEYDRNILRSLLTSLVPEYEPLKKDEVEPLVLKTSPKAHA